MRTIAIIPCKRTSERLPSKNMMRVGGQTLVERAAFVASGLDLVVLASDAEAIIEQGIRQAERQQTRAVGFPLDEQLAGKRAHLEDVISEVIRRHPADRYVLLQPTSPLRKRRHVHSALAILSKTGCDSVISVHEVTKDVYFSGTIDRDGRWASGRPKGVRLFTSQLPKLVAENGAVYAWTHDCWSKHRDRSGGDCRAMEMDVDDAIDIDTPAELERAQRRFSWVDDRHET